MSAGITAVKGWFLAKTPVLCALAAALFGTAAEVSGVVADNGNKVFWVSMCALAGAFAGSLPRILGAIFGYKQSEREFVGKELHGLVATLKKNASDNERILALSTSIRHAVQEGYQAAIWRIALLEREFKESGKTFDMPPLTHVDVAGLLREMDSEVKKIKAEKPHNGMVSV